MGNGWNLLGICGNLIDFYISVLLIKKMNSCSIKSIFVTSKTGMEVH